MKLSDYVIDFIVRQGVSHVFEFIGGAITHLLDSTVDRDDIACVSVHHEQAGAFAAEAYARINGRLGVAMATSGPGALNMVTGIGSCWFDSVPCLFVTGQVNTYEYKFDRPVRQIGFQETDIVSVVRSLTKYAELVTEPSSIKYHLEKAVYLAQTGRPGPVLLDLPMNVQRAEIDPEQCNGFLGSEEHRRLEEERPKVPDAVVAEVLGLIQTAQRPIILAGGGVRGAGATHSLRALADRTGIPVVSTLMGIDSLPGNHPCSFGMIGSYGNRFSNLAIANCDLVLVLGARLDTRQTGTRPDTFAREARRVHVDIDLNELNAKVKADLAVHADVNEFLAVLISRLEERPLPDFAPWRSILAGYRAKYPTRSLEGEAHPAATEPNAFLRRLSHYLKEGDIVCLDVGQNQMWAAQSLQLGEGQRMLNSGGMGAMGFALPAALGAAKAAPASRVIAIQGDGGLQINIQDLDTIVQHRLPVKLLVLNNGCLGMVRQFQDMYFNGRQQSTVVGYGCPDLVKIAQAYGVATFSLAAAEEDFDVVARFLDCAGPAFLNVDLERGTCVNPKLVVNRPLEDMSPHLDREELRQAMIIEPLEE